MAQRGRRKVTPEENLADLSLANLVSERGNTLDDVGGDLYRGVMRKISEVDKLRAATQRYIVPVKGAKGKHTPQYSDEGLAVIGELQAATDDLRAARADVEKFVEIVDGCALKPLFNEIATLEGRISHRSTAARRARRYSENTHRDWGLKQLAADPAVLEAEKALEATHKETGPAVSALRARIDEARGIEATSTRRDGRAGRYFTFDLRDRIEELLGGES